MKKETKQRIAIFCTGIPLAMMAVTIGCCFANAVLMIVVTKRASFFDVSLECWLDSLLWSLVFGCVPSAPAILAMLIAHAYWRTGFQKHTPMTVLLSLVLGAITRLIPWVMGASEKTNIFMELSVTALTCLATVIIVEFLAMKS